MTDYSNESIETSDEQNAISFDAAPSRLTIDLAAIVSNWRTMATLSGSARTAAVLKADAYGLGVEDVGDALYRAGAMDFFVAVPEEGAALRGFAPAARIFVLSGMWPGTEQVFFDNNLVPVLSSLEQITFFCSTIEHHIDFPCALQVDTGFLRLGVTVDDALQLATHAASSSRFSPILVISHLACSDDPSSPMNPQQLAQFSKVAVGFKGIEASLSASAGIYLGPDYHFNLTRPGIALYGGDSQPGTAKNLKTSAIAEARIIQIRNAKAGEVVSYGATCKLTRDSRLAIVAAGYADGYPRAASGSGVPLRNAVGPGGYGFIAGHHVPIAGRVTMDMTIFDITDVPENAVRAGDYIELIGHNIALDDAAMAAGTIGYEMLTSLGLRYQRRYTKSV